MHIKLECKVDPNKKSLDTCLGLKKAEAKEIEDFVEEILRRNLPPVANFAIITANYTGNALVYASYELGYQYGY